MSVVSTTLEGNVLIVHLSGKVDSSNANDVEAEIEAAVSSCTFTRIVIEAGELEYISSAGLRIVLRLLKKYPDLAIVNVSTEIYEILDITGFTEMVEVHKAMRVVSVEGCEIIGRGANGAVYRIDADTIVKVFKHPEAFTDIERERALARTAFVHGIPTAIPYDVVRVDDTYGTVYELLAAKSFSKLIIDGDKTVDEVAQMSSELLLQIHSTVIDDDLLPDMRLVALDWVDFMADYLPADKYEKLRALVEAVPESNNMLHGDYHINNIMYQNGESLLIDMDTICHGNPIFDFGSMYNAYQGFGLFDHETTKKFLGIDYDTSTEFWYKSLAIYLGTDDETRIREVESKAQVIGLTRLIRRNIRRGSLETEEGKATTEALIARLCELIDTTDTLLF